ncbi:MAG: hypothetical protein AAF378_21065 [Cyanobacteria bacterium P01_A01_bin.84]
MVERAYIEGAYLGIGFNSLTEEYRNRGVKVGSKNAANDSHLEREVFQEVYFSYEHITDETMLANSLGISGSLFNKNRAGYDFSDAGWSFGGNASASFSAKAKFFSKRNWRSSYTYILVKCLVENEKYRLRDTVLTDEASKTLAGKDKVDRFREKFGDEFVVGFSTGGEYFALIEVSSFDTASQTNLVADVRAEIEYHLQKLGFDTEHETKIDIGAKVDNFQRNKNMNLNVAVYRAGCQDIGHAFVMSIEQIVQEISILPAYVRKTGGIKFTSIFSDYGTIIGEQYQQIISKDLKRQKEAIARLGNKKQEDLNQLARIARQLEHVGYDSPSLKAERNEIIRRIYEIDKYARQCIDNPRSLDEEILRDLLIWN